MSEAEVTAPAETQERDQPRADDTMVRRAVANVRPSSFDEDTRSVEVVFTTGAQVTRQDFWTGERWIEGLEVTDEAVDLSRLNAGAPLLNSHGQWDLTDVIGVVERAWIDGGKGLARVRFSDRPEVAPIIADVRSGILRNVSVGYSVQKWRKEDATEKAPAKRIATRWLPMEISVVPVPADAAAQVRSAAVPPPVQETTRMNPETPANPPPPEAPAPATPPTATRNVSLDQLMEMAEAGGLDIAWVRARHAENLTLPQASQAAIRAVAERAPQPPRPAHTPHVTGGGQDQVETRRKAIVDSLLHVAGVHKELPEAARQYRGLSLLDLAREAITFAGGDSRGMDKMEVAGAALGLPDYMSRAGMHATTDFPIALANTANRVLQEAYTNAPVTWREIVRVGTAKDFRPISLVGIGGYPDLLKVAEGAEYTYGTVAESGEQITIGKFGRLLAFTREAIINDDINVFSDLPASAGVAAADVIDAAVWSIVTNGHLTTPSVGQMMSDGVQLYHANHGNDGTGAISAANMATTITAIGGGRKAMMIQKDLSGRQISVVPSILVVGPDKLQDAEQFLGTGTLFNATANQSTVNPYAGRLRLVTTTRISGNGWYLFADPGRIAALRVLFLNGQQTPVLEREQGFKVDGVTYKARIEFGAKATEYRATFRSTGA